MKRIFLFLLVLLLLFASCDSGKSGPFCVINDTEVDLDIIVSAETYSDVRHTIKAKEEFNTGIDYYTPTVKIVKDFESTAESNEYESRRDGFTTHIYKIPPTKFSVKNRIPSDVFLGTDTLYFYERNGKTVAWTDEDAKQQYPINADTKDFTISCFTKTPGFVLESISDAGEKTVGKCNGYSVAIKIESGIIYLE